MFFYQCYQVSLHPLYFLTLVAGFASVFTEVPKIAGRTEAPVSTLVVRLLAHSVVLAWAGVARLASCDADLAESKRPES